MTWLAAAICTNRTPEEVSPALGELAAQVDEVNGTSAMVVTSGLSQADHERHADGAARVGAAAVREQRPGLSVARNRALEELGGERVLAFLDDDAIPCSGWLARLAAHWRGAGDDVGCIGGAIVPRWLSPRPAWLAPSIEDVLSLLDRGEGTIEMEPGFREVYGANISFRADALREVGGFDPERGPWRGLPLFGDESAVQRLMAERGMRVLYAGDVRVEHCLDPERLTLREVARRRFLYGVGLGAQGGRRGIAAARAIKATVGVAAAAALRRPALVGERTVRASENAGVASAPLVLRRLRRRGWPAG